MNKLTNLYASSIEYNSVLRYVKFRKLYIDIVMHNKYNPVLYINDQIIYEIITNFRYNINRSYYDKSF